MNKYIEEVLDKSKIIVFDCDGVLSTPLYEKNNHMVQGTDNYDENKDFSWIRYCMEHNDSYKYCDAPDKMKNLVNKYSKSKDLYVLTTEVSSFALYDKIMFIKRNYGNVFDDKIHFVSQDNLKVPVLLEIAKIQGVKLSELVLIEDTFATCIKACDAGISAIHISHFL